MGKSIPTLGFPSRTAAVLSLFESGLRFPQIARKIGIPEKSVQGLYYCGLRHDRRGRPGERMARTIVVPNDILGALNEPAARRGISVNELARRILDTVAFEKMVDAVLDDEVTNA